MCIKSFFRSNLINLHTVNLYWFGPSFWVTVVIIVKKKIFSSQFFWTKKFEKKFQNYMHIINNERFASDYNFNGQKPNPNGKKEIIFFAFFFLKRDDDDGKKYKIIVNWIFQLLDLFLFLLMVKVRDRKKIPWKICTKKNSRTKRNKLRKKNTQCVLAYRFGVLLFFFSVFSLLLSFCGWSFVLSILDPIRIGSGKKIYIFLGLRSLCVMKNCEKQTSPEWMSEWVRAIVCERPKPNQHEPNETGEKR